MMAALEAVLRRPRSVLTVMVVLVLAGIVAYLTIPKEADPDIPVPVFQILVLHNGISPEDAERLLVRPMETELRGLEGLKELTAVAGQGYAVFVVEFNVEIDQDTAARDVREKVDLAEGDLPDGAEDPIIKEINMSLFPTIIATLYGDVPERTLYNHARRLKDQIEGISTVLEARLTGHREELLEVIIDGMKLDSYRISQSELISAVTRNNRLVPAGALDTGKGRFNIKVPGLFATARDVMSLPVKVSGDGVVTLGDVAQVRRTFKDAAGFARYNGKPAIAIQVIKRLGSNIVETNEAVRKVVKDFTRDWPQNIHVDYTFDQSSFVFSSLSNLQSSILTAIALVMIIVVAALGLRSALLVGISIPASFMIGFLFVGFFGLTINMMVMFGLVLTVGILVDGAIVIVEYADRKMAEGLDRKEAYILAAQRMFWPIFSSTATTLAAFLPMLLWPGVAGKFMSFLPMTVIIVLIASFVTAMVFLPVLGSLIGKRPSATERDALANAMLSGQTKADYTLIRGVTGLYLRFIRRIIPHPAKVLVTSLLLVLFIVQMFGHFARGVVFIPETDIEQSIIFIRAKGNLSALEKLDLTRQVERLVLTVPGVRSAFTTAGSGGGLDLGPRAGQDMPRDTVGQIFVEFDPFGQRPPGKEIFAAIRKKLASLPGILVELKKQEKGPPTGKDVRLQVRTEDYATLIRTIARLRDYFETGIKGLRDIEDDRPLPGIEWVLDVDREEAGRYGTDIVSVGGIIQLVTNGILIGSYRPADAEDEIDIRARFPRDERNLNRLDTLRISAPGGLVPISNLVTRKAQPRVNSITRRDGKYSMYIKANVEEGLLADTKVREINAWLQGRKWPAGVRFKFRGADEEQKKSRAFLMKAMAGALFLMFIILVTQFNSFYQTFITLSTVVLSIIGVLIGMMVTGQAFSIIMTGTGVVALAGVVVNNAIVLIDTFNRLHQQGLETVDAVLRTCAQRLRPVMLTTVTTIIGLSPMALSLSIDFINREIGHGNLTSSWWIPLSTAIIFGLGFATLLTLVLTPVLLALPDVYRKKYACWRASRRRSGATGGL